jgi:hypothetical protein
LTFSTSPLQFRVRYPVHEHGHFFGLSLEDLVAACVFVARLAVGHLLFVLGFATSSAWRMFFHSLNVNFTASPFRACIGGPPRLSYRVLLSAVLPLLLGVSGKRREALSI